MKSVFVKDIRAGNRIEDSFLVTGKNMAFSQKGSPYLVMKLRDNTGEIEGRVWDNAGEIDKKFRKGDIIRISCRAVSFKNMIQLSITDVARLEGTEVDPADYLPVSKHDIGEMFAELLAIIETVDSPHLKKLLMNFMSDGETAELFRKVPAAKGLHHVYAGGLLEHTLSVTKLIDKTAGHYPGADRDLLIAGGIIHDIGKTRELTCNGIIEYTGEGRLIGHIVIGLEMLDSQIGRIEGFPPQLAVELRHLILSHHGMLEFGSPKRPKTVEAVILHQIDDMDAKVNAFQEFIDSSPDDDSDWTPYHRLFDRFIYKGKTGGNT